MRPCSVPDCDCPHVARGFCARHYSEARKRGLARKEMPTACSVTGCESPVKSKGMCRYHYNKSYTEGRSELCAFDGCKNKKYAREWCNAHYKRWVRHGDPAIARTPPGTCLEHLHKVFRDPWPSECVIWPYSGSTSGYGSLQVNGRTQSAHRAMCELAYGSPPTARHEAAHNCGNGNKGCFNPTHLRWATHKENMQDTILHGTAVRGEAQKNAKLTMVDVREIRRRADTGETQASIAKDFGISATTVAQIWRGDRWAHVK